MTRTLVDRSGFGRLFTEFTHTAWRWECQGTYHEASEAEPWRQWRAGVRDHTWIQPWTDAVAGWRRVGKTFARVRMLTDPLTDYLRWMLEVTDVNVGAGEDIRWITQARAAELGMPGYDFYLFDDARVVILQFGQAGVSGAELIDDPAVVHDHRTWRDRVWPVAVPHIEYVSHTSRGVRD